MSKGRILASPAVFKRLEAAFTEANVDTRAWDFAAIEEVDMSEADHRPRGIRNNNPGNIDRTHPRQGWLGALPDAEITDPRFEQFSDALYGLRAIGKTLISYHDKHNCRTVRDFIYRWAPPGPADNNPSASYSRNVAEKLGFSSDLSSPNITNSSTLITLTQAIVRQENGEDPYEYPLYIRAANMALAK